MSSSSILSILLRIRPRSGRLLTHRIIGAKEDVNPSSHLKSTLQELKESVVDGVDRFARYTSVDGRRHCHT